jgi:hypothetical protein
LRKITLFDVANLSEKRKKVKKKEVEKAQIYKYALKNGLF